VVKYVESNANVASDFISPMAIHNWNYLWYDTGRVSFLGKDVVIW
jgi:hypothetical protein